jgi:Mor family transcriptional regulator
MPNTERVFSSSASAIRLFSQFTQGGKHARRLFRAIRLALKTVQRHIRRIGFQQKRRQRQLCHHVRVLLARG